MAKAKPVSAEDRKAIGARLKAGRERAAAEKAELIRLREENERLKGAAAKAAIDDTAAAIAEIAKRKEQPNESRDWKDDLEWIDESVHSVAIVSKNMTLTLRPYNTRVFPPIESVAVHASSSGPWIANPFDLRSNEANVDARARKEKHNAVMYANWGYFRITRELAKDVYGDPRQPVPEEAVVDSREFRGYDREVHRAVGTFRKLAVRDPLRECIRALLQRLDSTFIDASRHGDKIMRGFDPRVPNPYRRKLGNLVQKLPAVKVEGATA